MEWKVWEAHVNTMFTKTKNKTKNKPNKSHYNTFTWEKNI